MWKVGMKVYAHDGNDFYCGEGNPIIGEIIEVSHDSCYIKSIVDGHTYFVAKYKLYEVGTGPVMKKYDVVYEDYYV